MPNKIEVYYGSVRNCNAYGRFVPENANGKIARIIVAN